jgi:hypothetical protein
LAWADTLLSGAAVASGQAFSIRLPAGLVLGVVGDDRDPGQSGCDRLLIGAAQRCGA